MKTFEEKLIENGFSVCKCKFRKTDYYHGSPLKYSVRHRKLKPWQIFNRMNEIFQGSGGELVSCVFANKVCYFVK